MTAVTPPFKAHSTASNARVIAIDYELEARTRLAEMETRIQTLLETLKRRCESEIARLPADIHQMSAGEFLGIHGGDIKRAAASLLNSQMEVESQTTEYLAVVQQSTKKRKRNLGDTPSVPPSPGLPRSKRVNIDPMLLDTPKAATSGTLQLKRKLFSPAPTTSAIVQQDPFQIPNSEFTFQCTLESVRQGIRDELRKTNMAPGDRDKLESRLLSLVDGLKQSEA